MARKIKRIGRIEYDLTCGGLFKENLESGGFKWRSKQDRKGRKRSVTPGSTKPGCKASKFARYCATYARARKHSGYTTQVQKWKDLR